jgi:hypothetical protein
MGEQINKNPNDAQYKTDGKCDKHSVRKYGQQHTRDGIHTGKSAGFYIKNDFPGGRTGEDYKQKYSAEFVKKLHKNLLSVFK